MITQVFGRKVLPLFSLLFLAFGSSGAFAQSTPAPVDTRALLLKIQRVWRSSDQYIDHATLLDTAFRKIPARLLSELKDVSQADLQAELIAAAASGDQTLLVNKGMAENLFKIRKMAERRARNADTAPRAGELVYGLKQSTLEKLTTKLPEVSPENRRAGEFSFFEYDIDRRFVVNIEENDFYAIKIAAMWWKLGAVNQRKTTSEIFARGREEIGYVVAAGQDYFIRGLPKARFSEKLIQRWKKHPTMSRIPDGFWDYMRNWRYTGDVDFLQPGTITAANVPIIRFYSNPLDNTLVEAPLMGAMDEAMRAATYASRSVDESGGVPIVDGSARRGQNADVRAMGSYIGGFMATANTHAAGLFNIPETGSAQNHATIGQSRDELDAHIQTLEIYDADQSLMLSDTYDIREGIMLIVRAGGPNLKGIRVDQPIPGMTPLQTIKEVERLLVEAGFLNIKVSARDGVRDGATDNKIAYTDDLNENTMAEIRAGGGRFSFALMGGRLKNGPSLGLVMKTSYTEIFNERGKLVDHFGVAKTGSVGKAGTPGDKKVYRVFDPETKAFKYDLVTDVSEAAPANGTALLISGIKNGEYVGPRETLQVQQARVTEQKKILPVSLFSVKARAGDFPVIYSEKLLADKEANFKAHSPAREHRKERIGVFPYSGDPTHEGHADVVSQVKARYGMDRVIIDLTGDNPIHGKKYALSAQARLAQAKIRFRNIPNIEYYMGEIEAKVGVPTVETMAAIQAANPKAELYIIGGEDLMRKQLPKFTRIEELLAKYHFVFVEREVVDNRSPESTPYLVRNSSEKGDPLLPPELLKFFEIRNPRKGGNLLRHKETGKLFELGAYPFVTKASSTEIRNFYDAQSYSFRLHTVDPQWTFADRSALPNVFQRFDGTLSVEGTSLTIPAIAKSIQLAIDSGIALVSTSADAHTWNEFNNKDLWNQSHAVDFPAHGMDGVDGPAGDEFVTEVQAVLNGHKEIVVPHYRDKGTSEIELVPFDMEAVAKDARSPETLFRFKKNGPNSPNVFSNPRYAEYLDLIDPYKVLPHFVTGWCTDICEKAVVMEMLNRGYNMFVIVDASAGFSPLGTAQTFQEMDAKGATFITTAEYEMLVKRWSRTKATWREVLTQLAEWKKTSQTQDLVLKRIQSDFWKNEMPVKGQCAVYLTKQAS